MLRELCMHPSSVLQTLLLKPLVEQAPTERTLHHQFPNVTRHLAHAMHHLISSIGQAAMVLRKREA